MCRFSVAVITAALIFAFGSAAAASAEARMRQ